MKLTVLKYMFILSARTPVIVQGTTIGTISMIILMSVLSDNVDTIAGYYLTGVGTTQHQKTSYELEVQISMVT